MFYNQTSVYGCLFLCVCARKKIANAMRRKGDGAMDTDARRLAILEAIKESKLVRVSELSRQFGVSEVSIRRDLVKLGEYGLLRRVHGGAVTAAEATDHFYDEKRGLREAEKQRIGKVAAALIKPGERVILDSGTTVLEIAREIAHTPALLDHLTVITASFPVFRELSAARSIHLVVLGGIYLPEFQTLVGPYTLAPLRDLHVDKLFLGADGLSFGSGVTTANVLEAEVSRAMIRAAQEVVVVADSSKVDAVGFATIMPLTGAHHLITDSGVPESFVANLREQGVLVTLV
jgi:DeoR/GlpR family transcriptional regulator of sugar metabolism